MNTAPRFIFANARASNIRIVFLSRGQCTETKSERERSSSRLTEVAPRRAISSSVRYGSVARTDIPNAFANEATKVPMLPTPTSPSVRP
jgi:hypothetical protein